jgi:hypothetical protein
VVKSAHFEIIGVCVPPKPKRWQIAPRVSLLVVARFPDLHPLIVQILYNRGITTPEQAETFLAPDALIGNPFQMRGVNETIDRLRRAIRAKSLSRRSSGA